MRSGRDEEGEAALALPNAIAVTPAESKSRLPHTPLVPSKKALLLPLAECGAPPPPPRRGLEPGDDDEACEPPSPSSGPPRRGEGGDGDVVSASWTLRAFSSRACRARFRLRGDEDDDGPEVDSELREEADDTTVEALDSRRREAGAAPDDE
jgi:hypothetical protein